MIGSALLYLSDFGNEDVKSIMDAFPMKLEAQGVNTAKVLMEWRILKVIVFNV